MDLDELKIVLWNRFGSLREESDPGSLQLTAILKTDRDASVSQLSIKLSCTEDLERYSYLAREEREVCPRITIMIG